MFIEKHTQVILEINVYDIFRVDLNCSNYPRFGQLWWLLIRMVEEEGHHHVHFSEEVTVVMMVMMMREFLIRGAIQKRKCQK